MGCVQRLCGIYMKHSISSHTGIIYLVSLRSLHSLLDYEGDDIEDVFCLSFVMSREVFGSVQTDELKPGGANILVTQKNKYTIYFKA